MAYYVYMLRCGDGSLYTGSTGDVSRRVKVHQSGKGAKYTRSRLPVFCQVIIPGFAKANSLVLPRKFPGNCQINSLVLPRYFTRMRALRRR